MVTQKELGVTHNCDVVEMNSKSVCCIYDKNPLNQIRYARFSENPNLQAKIAVNYYFEDPEQTKLLGITLKLNIISLDDTFEYVLDPSDEFTENIVRTKEIQFSNSTTKNMFTLSKIDTTTIEKYHKLFPKN